MISKKAIPMWRSHACCLDTCRGAIPKLLACDKFAVSSLNDATGQFIKKHVPERVQELTDALFFVASTTESPFWGVHSTITCPVCHDASHLLIIDETFLVIINQLVLQLTELADSSSCDELTFRAATVTERSRAQLILTSLVFHTEFASLVTATKTEQCGPGCLLGYMLEIAVSFVVCHETSHQGPQSIGPSYYNRYLPGVLDAALRSGISLGDRDADAWAKEFAADANAFAIMAVQGRRVYRDQLAQWSWMLISGVALALKAWDLVIQELCFGNETLYRNLLRTHPPSEQRLAHILLSAKVSVELGQLQGDIGWAQRVLHAVDDLHRGM
jgi:hypothetical protein